MQKGEFDPNSKLLRAKIDMNSENSAVCDPYKYVIGTNSLFASDAFFLACLNIALDIDISIIIRHPAGGQRPRITSFYNWICNNLVSSRNRPIPHLIQLSSLQLQHDRLHEAAKKELIKNPTLMGWDDPRLPTIQGMRRRGYSAKAIRDLAKRFDFGDKNINETTVPYSAIEYTVRQDLLGSCFETNLIVEPIEIIIQCFEEEQQNFEVQNALIAKELYLEYTEVIERIEINQSHLEQGIIFRLKDSIYLKTKKIIRNEEGKIKKILCEYIEKAKVSDNFKKQRYRFRNLSWLPKSESEKIELRIFGTLFPGDTTIGKSKPI
jgi:glutaminyl-tRNA synthetase